MKQVNEKDLKMNYTNKQVEPEIEIEQEAFQNPSSSISLVENRDLEQNLSVENSTSLINENQTQNASDPLTIKQQFNNSQYQNSYLQFLKDNAGNKSKMFSKLSVLPSEQRFQICLGIIQKKSLERSNTDLAICQFVLSQIDFFSNLKREFGVESVIACLKDLKLQYHPQNSIIFRQGDSGNKFYVILKGKLIIFGKAQQQNEDQLRKSISSHSKGWIIIREKQSQLLGNFALGKRADYHKIAELQTGNSFGQLALLNNTCRSASIITEQQSFLAILEKKDYDKTVANAHRKLLKQNMEFLSSLTPFENMTRRGLQLLLKALETVQFCFRDYVYREGDLCEYIYVVTKGQFKVTQTINIKIKPDSDTSYVLDRSCADSFRPSKSNPTRTIELGILTAGEIFGGYQTMHKTVRSSNIICLSSQAQLYRIAYTDLVRKTDMLNEQVVIKQLEAYSNEKAKWYNEILSQSKETNQSFQQLLSTPMPNEERNQFIISQGCSVIVNKPTSIILESLQKQQACSVQITPRSNISKTPDPNITVTIMDSKITKQHRNDQVYSLDQKSTQHKFSIQTHRESQSQNFELEQNPRKSLIQFTQDHVISTNGKNTRDGSLNASKSNSPQTDFLLSSLQNSQIIKPSSAINSSRLINFNSNNNKYNDEFENPMQQRSQTAFPRKYRNFQGSLIENQEDQIVPKSQIFRNCLVNQSLCDNQSRCYNKSSSIYQLENQRSKSPVLNSNLQQFNLVREISNLFSIKEHIGDYNFFIDNKNDSMDGGSVRNKHILKQTNLLDDQVFDIQNKILELRKEETSRSFYFQMQQNKQEIQEENQQIEANRNSPAFQKREAIRNLKLKEDDFFCNFNDKYFQNQQYMERIKRAPTPTRSCNCRFQKNSNDNNKINGPSINENVQIISNLVTIKNSTQQTYHSTKVPIL